jgi:hypothetical protein
VTNVSDVSQFSASLGFSKSVLTGHTMLTNRKLIWPAFLVAFGLVLIPPADAAIQTFPFRFGDPTWRFGFFGIMSNAMLIPMLGLLIAFVASAVLEYRALQRALGAMCGVIAACLGAALIMFLLDVIQLHRQVKPGTYQRAFGIASSAAAIRAILSLIALSGFARAGLSTGRRARKASAKSPTILHGIRPTNVE